MCHKFVLFFLQEILMSSSAKELNQIISAYEFFKSTLMLSKYNSTNNNGKKRQQKKGGKE